MAEMLEVGSKAPAFSVKDQDGNTITLKDDVKGQWSLIYFYPKAMTSGCTKQACSVRDAKRELASRGIKVFGVSADPPERLREFADKEDLDFHLLGDPEHTMLEKYGAWGEKKMYGKTSTGILRISYLLDPEGTIRHAWPKVKTAEHASEVIEAFDELQGG